MDDSNAYYEDGVARVLDLLRATFGDYFKFYFDDELSDMPESYLPCVMVRESSAAIASGATGTDKMGEEITIIIALNVKDDLGGSTDTDLTGTRLRRIVKGQYPEGHAKAKEYHEKTVMYTLRQNFSLGDAIIDNQIDIDFELAQRGESIYTKEAYITLNIQRLALVPTRA